MSAHSGGVWETSSSVARPGHRSRSNVEKMQCSCCSVAAPGSKLQCNAHRKLPRKVHCTAVRRERLSPADGLASSPDFVDPTASPSTRVQLREPRSLGHARTRESVTMNKTLVWLLAGGAVLVLGGVATWIWHRRSKARAKLDEQPPAPEPDDEPLPKTETTAPPSMSWEQFDLRAHTPRRRRPATRRRPNPSNRRRPCSRISQPNSNHRRPSPSSS